MIQFALGILTGIGLTTLMGSLWFYVNRKCSENNSPGDIEMKSDEVSFSDEHWEDVSPKE
jgi:hypothetical protein